MNEENNNNIVCTKCGSDEVYIDVPEETKVTKPTTIDDMVGPQVRNAIYIPTTWRCKKCGYSVTG